MLKSNRVLIPRRMLSVVVLALVLLLAGLAPSQVAMALENQDGAPARVAAAGDPGWPNPAEGSAAGSTRVLLGVPGSTPHLSAGSQHALGVSADGKLWVWGYNSDGQVGDGGSVGTRAEPVHLDAFEGRTIVQAEASGFYNLALDSQGDVWGWGRNEYGEAGTGVASTTGAAYQRTPAKSPVLEGKSITRVFPGPSTAFALDAEGKLWIWGQASSADFRLSTPSTGSPIPTLVTGLEGRMIVDVEIVHETVVALDSEGVVWAWGSNSMGPHEGGPAVRLNSPQKVAAFEGTKIVKIDAGFGQVAALSDEGQMWTWGDNWNGSVGNGTTTISPIPAPVPALLGKRITDIATGAWHTLALDSENQVWAWGLNDNNQLGIYTPATGNSVFVGPRTVPTRVEGLPEAPAIIQLAGGGTSSYALFDDGSVRAWGTNTNGQLGSGTALSLRNTVTNSLAKLPSVVASNVSFDGVPGTGLQQNGRMAEVITPAHAAGPVDVLVQTEFPDGTAGPSLTYPEGFTYLEDMTVTPPPPTTGGRGQVSITINNEKIEVAPAEEWSYTLSVRNYSAEPAFDVVVSSQLPKNVRLLSTSLPGIVSSGDGDTLDWELGVLQAGEVRTLKITVVANADVQAGTQIVVTAKVVSSGECVDSVDTTANECEASETSRVVKAQATGGGSVGDKPGSQSSEKPETALNSSGRSSQSLAGTGAGANIALPGVAAALFLAGLGIMVLRKRTMRS